LAAPHTPLVPYDLNDEPSLDCTGGRRNLVALAAAIKRFVRQKRGAEIDVGTVSEGWLSEQRGRKDS
jgi:hypothetical protein